MVKIKINKELSLGELREIVLFMENQETSDKYTSTTIQINGDYAEIAVQVDEDGDAILL